VLEVEDLEDSAIDVDVVSVFELVGADDGNQPFLEPNFDVVRLSFGSLAARSQ
jgi:hypothetical protein